MFLKDEDVLKEFQPHVNENGMVPFGPPGAVTQNDTLFTVYYMLALLDALGSIPEAEKKRLREAYEKHITQDGLTKRTPQSDELESHDNLTGWGVASLLLERPEWSKRILAYARSTGWVYPDSSPSDAFRRYLGRHRVVEPHLMVAAGETPDFVLQLVWCATVLAAIKGVADSFSLTFCLVYLVNHSEKAPLSMKLVAQVWTLAQKIRGLSLGKNLAGYYGWAGSPHTKYLK